MGSIEEKKPQSHVCVGCKHWISETGMCAIFEESPGILVSCNAKETTDEPLADTEPQGEDCQAPESETEAVEGAVEESSRPITENDGSSTTPDDEITAETGSHQASAVLVGVDESRSLKGLSLSDDMPAQKPTVDFDMKKIVNKLGYELDKQRSEIYRHYHTGGEGTPVTDIKVNWGRNKVDCKAVTTMPPRKITSDKIEISVVHENGDIRMVEELEQVEMPLTMTVSTNKEGESTLILPQLEPNPVPDFFQIFTQSAIKLLQLCPKKFFFRYILGLVPQSSKTDALWFGTLIHKCLDIWHGPGEEPHTERVTEIKQLINSVFQDRDQDRKERHNWHYARAMMRAYAKRYPFGSEAWRTIATEKFFSGPIINPETGEELSWALYAGLVDLYAEDDFGKILPDHKTTASISSDYLEGLPHDLQLTSYALYLGQQENTEIGRIVYNILAKPKLEQAIGETEEEYQARYEAACAKSKNGKSTAKRKMPETDDEFQSRLEEWYSAPDKLHRAESLVDLRQFDEVRRELWSISQLFYYFRTTNTWPRNREACTEYGKCGYFDACMAPPEEEEQAFETFLRPEPPHSEILQFLDPKYGGTKGLEEYDYPVSFDLPDEGGE